MTCNNCKHLIDIDDLSSPYVVRTCQTCKRKINLREPGEKGHGIKVEKGDEFKIPKGWLQISANPLKGKGTLTRLGIEWFGKLIFIFSIYRFGCQRENSPSEYCSILR